MIPVNETKEFQDICSDLCLLFDRAEAIRDHLNYADIGEEEILCTQFAVLKEAIMEGTEFLQNRIFQLDRYGDHKASQIGEEEAREMTIAEAFGDDDLVFASESMRDYRSFRDTQDDDED